jgi:hypothetical protein
MVRERVPSKTVAVPRWLHVNCAARFIDFGGRADGLSVANILQVGRVVPILLL